MSFDWKEYYNLSKELNKNGLSECNRESQLRAAISRSYYAAFNCTKLFLKQYENTILINLNSIHKEIIEKLNEFSNPEYDMIASELFELKKLRQWADYENSVFQLENRTQLALKRCDTILKALDQSK